MLDTSQSYITYAGKKYFFGASIYENNQDNDFSLDNNAIESFTWENALNDLIIRGELVYSDSYGKMDKFIDKQYAFCQIYFAEIDRRYDNDIIIEEQSQTNVLKRVFLIDKFEIVDRNAETIKYKLGLIDSSIFNFQQLITFSNYDKDPEPILDILKACIQQADLKIDKDTFDRVKSDISLNYITAGKDTLISVVNYLMSRLFYYQKKDDSLKLIFFNEIMDVIQLFDVKDRTTGTQIDSVVLSLMKGKQETQIQSEPVQIGCIADMPKSKLLKSFFTNHIMSYDMAKNDFDDNTIQTDTIFQYYNKSMELEGNIGKYSSVKDNIFRHDVRDAYWNTDMAIYHNMVDNMFQNNAVVINVDGRLGRLPASYMTVSIDRDEQVIPPNENPELYQDQLTRYLGFEGMWIVSKVKHYVEVSSQRFRQSVFMFRNFVDAVAANS